MTRDRLNWGWIAAIVLLGLNLAAVLWPIDRPSSAQGAKRFVYKVIDVPGDTHALQAA